MWLIHPKNRQKEEILPHLAEQEVQGSGGSALGNPGARDREYQQRDTERTALVTPAAGPGPQSSGLLCGRSPDGQVMWTARGHALSSHIWFIRPRVDGGHLLHAAPVSGCGAPVTRRGSWRTWRRSGLAAPPRSTSRAAAACCSQTGLRCGVSRGTRRGKSAGQSRRLCHF